MYQPHAQHVAPAHADASLPVYQPHFDSHPEFERSNFWHQDTMVSEFECGAHNVLPNTLHDTEAMSATVIPHESVQGAEIYPTACAPHTLYGAVLESQGSGSPLIYGIPTANDVMPESIVYTLELDADELREGCAAQVTLVSQVRGEQRQKSVTLVAQLPPHWFGRDVQLDAMFKPSPVYYDTSLSYSVSLALHAHDTDGILNTSDAHVGGQVHQADLFPFQRQDPIPAQSILLAAKSVLHGASEYTVDPQHTPDVVPHQVDLQALALTHHVYSAALEYDAVIHPYASTEALPPTIVYATLDNGAPDLLQRGYFATEVEALQNAINLWGVDPQTCAGRQMPTGEWYWIRIPVCQNMCSDCPPTGYIQGG